MKDGQIATYTGPALALVVGAAVAGWSATRPAGFIVGVLIGAGVIAWAQAELRFRFKARQIAKKQDRRRGYVR